MARRDSQNTYGYCCTLAAAGRHQVDLDIDPELVRQVGNLSVAVALEIVPLVDNQEVVERRLRGHREDRLAGLLLGLAHHQPCEHYPLPSCEPSIPCEFP